LDTPKLLIFVGIALTVIGIFLLVYLRGYGDRPDVINPIGVWIFIIGLLCFAARGWVKWYHSEESSLEGLASKIQDVKTKKGKSKIKAVLILIGIIAFFGFIFLL